MKKFNVTKLLKEIGVDENSTGYHYNQSDTTCFTDPRPYLYVRLNCTVLR